MTKGPKPRPVIERLMARTEKTDGCWLWRGPVMANGYGAMNTRGRSRLVHRQSYEEHVGAIPEGLHLDHLCSVRNCLNPAHLEPVTPAENARRAGQRKTYCKWGHEFTPDNTYVEPTFGRRSCVACREAAVQRYQQKLRERKAVA